MTEDQKKHRVRFDNLDLLKAFSNFTKLIDFCADIVRYKPLLEFRHFSVEGSTMPPRNPSRKAQKLAVAAGATKVAPSESKIPAQKPAADRDLKIGFLIHDVSRLRRNTFDHFMKPLGITRSQWWVIAHLSRKDGMMQTELATLLDIGKVTLGGLVDRLDEAGWIERRQDASDRRAKRVYLTAKSLDVLREMRAVERMLNRSVLKGLNNEERDTLVELLGRVKANLVTTVADKPTVD
jgi:DNA-binding MarR family transcriptional regulator